MKKLCTTFAMAFLVFAQLWSQDFLSTSLQVTARLNGGNEVPSVSTEAQGLAVISVSGDRTSGQFSFQSTGLSGDITGIHIHAGPPDENGDVVLDLTPFVDGTCVQAPIFDGGGFSIAELLNGAYYLNVHTMANPGGEIRGQFVLETDILFGGQLSPSNEVPPADNGGDGYVSASLSSALTTLRIKSLFHNILVDEFEDQITGAHLHFGTPGTNGDVAINLSDFIFNNEIDAVVDASLIIEDLLTGNIYLNIHTAFSPGGAVRAQLLPVFDPITFECSLNGFEEVPGIETGVAGLVNFSYNPSANTLHYSGYVGTGSGSVMTGTGTVLTGAHLHMGDYGETGPVLVDLSSTVGFGNFNGTIVNPSNSLINKMLVGNVYMNVHSEENPMGEIRGQTNRLAREGYVAHLNGAQEVPPTAAPGKGLAIVSFDNYFDNAHFMVVADQIEGEYTSAHFHDGPAGQVGPPVFDLSEFFMNNGTSAYGYWTDVASSQFMFVETGAYINIHSSLYPGGEIRGDFIPGDQSGPDCTFNVGVNISMPISDADASDACLFATPSGGVLPYTYSWDTGATSQEICELPQGEYCVTVTDAAGCTGVDCKIISIDPLPLGLGTHGVDPSTEMSSDGSVSALWWGGIPDYTVTWSTGDTGPEVLGLSSGTYCATVTDGNGNTATDCVTISTIPAPLGVGVGADHPSSPGASDGTAFALHWGGAGPYSYLWDTGATTQGLSGLPEGNYCVTVTDSNGTTATDCKILSASPTPLGVGTGVNDITVFGANDGEALALVWGGTPGFTYAWNNGATTAFISGLAAGEYCVTVTDSNGMTNSDCTIVEEPAPLGVGANSNDVTSPGGSDGEALALVWGGTPGYTYSWDNGETTDFISGLTAGEYCVTVTDSNGASNSDCTTVEEPPPSLVIGGNTNASARNNDLADVASSVQMFPNPTKGNVTISFGLETILDQPIEVYNTIGERILTLNKLNSNQVQLNLDGQADGLYLIRFHLNGEHFTKRLLLVK